MYGAMRGGVRQVTVTDVWPAEPTVITPPQLQLHCDESSSAGTPPIVTFDDPGDHGLSTGTHGWGVSTPDAALVAAATCGLASDVHSANGGTLLGATSVTTPAAAVASTSTPEAANVDGAVPNEHCNAAPVQTWLGICHLPSRRTKGMPKL
jgi:hypothetical protein